MTKIMLFLEKGFTLIELLVVVAIIGILAGIIGANMTDALRRADDVACKKTFIPSSCPCRRTGWITGDFRLRTAWPIRFPNRRRRRGVAARRRTGIGPASPCRWSSWGIVRRVALYCPALKRQNGHTIEAHSSCGNSNFSGKEVPQWRFLRYAYDRASIDSGGPDHESEAIGLFNIDRNTEDVWDGAMHARGRGEILPRPGDSISPPHRDRRRPARPRAFWRVRSDCQRQHPRTRGSIKKEMRMRQLCVWTFSALLLVSAAVNSARTQPRRSRVWGRGSDYGYGPSVVVGAEPGRLLPVRR